VIACDRMEHVRSTENLVFGCLLIGGECCRVDGVRSKVVSEARPTKRGDGGKLRLCLCSLHLT
jgi:hypothetical protein